MAKKKNKKNRRAGGNPPAPSQGGPPQGGAGSSGTALADDAEQVARAGKQGDETLEQSEPADGGDRNARNDRGSRRGSTGAGAASGAGVAGARAGQRGGFFDLYKRGQGYYTRMGTGIGAGVLILLGADYMYGELQGALPADRAWALYLQTGLPLAVGVLLAVLVWWLAGVNRRSCDFMIATEGEMKKVNWSSTKSVVSSTKVVIVFVLLMGSLLFIIDALFMLLFNTIGVLEVAPNILKSLFGSE